MSPSTKTASTTSQQAKKKTLSLAQIKYVIALHKSSMTKQKSISESTAKVASLRKYTVNKNYILQLRVHMLKIRKAMADKKQEAPSVAAPALQEPTEQPIIRANPMKASPIPTRRRCPAPLSPLCQ
ncbi:hypothetical protein GCK72_004184 [Caenorhabditis remanei]|uniref:Uncharacterized protein n=1 Tax=Caenorhabditis remanei TaxID=31234 RepID=A0A6A5HAS0_CAERE|nr:hypothetical protein GCK72_004184 [Caenorhabditis remanei]KAF1764237.1 hypothetical protein GCK72_004184 [Caenorhabditis remanei]